MGTLGLAAAGLMMLGPGGAAAQDSSTPHISYLWHLHQPIYWPGQKTNGAPDRYEYARETITGIQSGRGFPIDNVGDYFDVDDREAVYQGRPWFAIDNADNSFNGRDAGAQVTYSGSLMENVASLAGNWATYGSGWKQPFIDGRRARTSTNNKPKIDMVNFSYHHALLPLLTPRTVELELRLHQRKMQLELGTDQPVSRGLFPTEMCYSPWLIPHLKAAGIEWTIVSGNHLSRAMPDFPLQFGTGGENTQPPNRADVRNPLGVNWFRKTIDRGCSPVNAAPFSYTPHRNYWINPDTGTTETIIVVPAAQEFGWDDGYKVIGPGEFATVRQFNNPSRPMLMMLAHDGDNAFGGGFSYYFEGVSQMVNQAPGAGWFSSTVEEYLARHPVPQDALVHVENGGWVNPDGDFGSPTFINWNYPLLNSQGQIDPENGWHEKPREYAIHLAAENRLRTAEAKVGGAGTTRLDNIINPGLGDTSAVERGWHYYLGSLDSGYLYYGDYGDVEVRGTVGINKAMTLVDPILATGFTDTVSPSVWLPQRWPYNPGAVNFGVETQYRQRTLGPDFTVWTFGYDAGSTVTATLKWRVDGDGQIGIHDTHNSTYAGGPGVGAWNDTPMNRRAFPANNIYNKPTLNYFVLPSHIADHFSAKITGQAGKMIDYYVEAVDAAGNVTRSPIQHVYVGTETGESGGGGGTGSRVQVNPNPPVAGQAVGISYSAAGGALAGAASINLYYGINNWTPVVETARAMQFDAGTQRWWTTVTLSASANRLNMVFNNGAGTWDNNGGADYNFDVTGGTTPPPPPWTIDGNVEPVDYLRSQTTGGLALYAAVNGNKLYVATNSPSGGNDHFLYIARSPGALRAANWGKAGQIAAWDAFLASESTNSFVGWFNASGTNTPAVPGTLAARNGLIEGEIDLSQLFPGEDLPGTIYLAAAAFGTNDAGALVSATQCPVTVNGNGNIDGPEYLGYPLNVAPVMGVESPTGTPIQSGDDVPSISDGTEFGDVLVAAGVTSRTFVIRNTGNAPLGLSSAAAVSLQGTHAGDFVVSSQPATTITAGSTSQFVVQFDPSALGERLATVSIGQANGAPYVFAIRGTGTEPTAPVVGITGNGQVIAHNDVTPDAADGTAFGSAEINGGEVYRSFAVTNGGQVTLQLDSNPTVVRIAPGVSTSVGEFTISSQPPSTVPGNGSTSFTVRFAPQSTGAKLATVSVVPTNASNGSIYSFTVGGTGVFTPPPTPPTIGITGNGQSIGNGDSTPSSVDGTAFPNLEINSGQSFQTFSIGNAGQQALNLDSVPSVVRVVPGVQTQAGEFAITSQAAASVAGGSSTSFVVRFAPVTTGTKSATIQVVPLNVSGTTSYTFVVSGTGVFTPPPPPAISVAWTGGGSIANGSTTISTGNGTDYGNLPLATTITRTLRILNSGGQPLTLGGSPVVQVTTVGGPQAQDFVITRQPTSTVAPGTSVTFDLAFSPTLLGSRLADVSIPGLNDPDDSQFLFRVGGQGIQAITPELLVDGPNGPIPNEDQGVLDVTPFGSSRVGQAVTLDFEIRGNVEATFGPSAVSITGPGASSFALSGPFPGTAGTTVPSPFSVRFQPTAAGTQTATIQIQATNGAVFRFGLEGSGLIGPRISVVPQVGITGSGNQFTFLTVGSYHYRVGDMLIQNTGDQDLLLTGSPALTLAPEGLGGTETATSTTHFLVVAQPVTTIPPGGNSFIALAVLGRSTGGILSTNATISGAASGIPDFTFGIQAALDLTSQLELSAGNRGLVLTNVSLGSQPSFDFGSVVVNQPESEAVRSFVLTNRGNVTRRILAFRTVEGTISDWRVPSSIPETVLAPGASMTVTAIFAPTILGASSANFEFLVDDSVPRVIRLGGTGISQPTGFAPVITNAFPSSTGWLALGQSGPLFTGSIGSRAYDSANTALTAVVGASSRGRIIGWIEDSASDLPYSQVGTGNFVRAKYSLFYSGPGDSRDLALSNRVPNFRLSLRTRGVVTTQLEVNHNSQTGGSPAQQDTTRELGPSKNPAAPSVYRVDFDPVDVPYLTGSATEGIQRGFETVVSGADYSFVSGTLGLTDSSIGTYPALNQGVAAVKTFASGGSDFNNDTIVLARLGYSAAELFRYVAGPAAGDYFNPSILNVTVNSEAGVSVTRSSSGITVDTQGLAATRVGVTDAAFNGGVFGDTNASRLRVEPGKLYQVSIRLRHQGGSGSTPYTRFNARTAGFGWNASLELLGGRGLSSGDGQSFLAQVLPGTGNQVPGTTTDGTTYRLIFGTPLSPEIRADVAGTLAQKFPTLSTQPGPGDPASSLRNVNFGFTVADSLSLVSATATDTNEAANNLILNRIEVREYPQIAD